MNYSQLVAIVDDDEAVRRALESFLRSAGHQTITFSSADSFLADDLADRARCVITDYQMPGRDGLALQLAIRERRPDVTVILMTAHPSDTVRRQALDAGAAAFLSKPVDPERLLQLVEAALSRQVAPPAEPE